MRKKLLFIALFLIALTTCAFGFTACNFGGDNNRDTPPEYGVSPTGIILFVGTDFIGIRWAEYADGNYTTEYRLDDGEWLSPASSADEEGYYIRFENLIPGSTHNVSARAAANGSILPSEPFTKQVTLEKAERKDSPEVSVKMAGKTCTIEGFTEEMELGIWVDHSTLEYIDSGTYTFTECGRYNVNVRYKETATHKASEPTRLYATASIFSGGVGTEEEPFLIDTYEQFAAIAEQDEVVSTRRYVYFKLTSDIVFPGEVQEPIAQPSYWLCVDGGGHKIISPKIRSSAGWYTGIFERLVGKVQNLNVENAEIIRTVENFESSGFSVGIIAGDSSEIINCHVQGVIKLEIAEGEDFGEYSQAPRLKFGGLVGATTDKIQASSAEVKIILPQTVEHKYSYFADCGGLAGIGKNASESWGKLGVFGSQEGDCVALSLNVGGLFGQTYGAEIENCYAEANVTAELKEGMPTAYAVDSHFGGLVGDSDNATIKNCYAHYNFSVNNGVRSNTAYVGGIAGKNVSAAENTFAQGAVHDYGGDIKTDGFAFAVNDGGAIENCYCEEGIASLITNVSATPQADLRSASWQRAHLNWSEEIWLFHDFGATDDKFYPTLK